MSIAVSLDTAMRALIAQQAAIDAVSHNVANVATPGYSRQRVRLNSLPPVSGFFVTPAAGRGVEVVGVERMRDLFIDFQIRIANHSSGRYEARATSLQRVEIALGEPSESGLRAAMGRFWNAWRDLANSPDSTPARTTVLETARTLATTFSTVRSSLTQLRAQADTRIKAAATEINSLTREIATLNQSVANLVASGGGASDLQDARDLALDRLSTLLDVQYIQRDDGWVDVTIGGRSLVRGAQSFDIYGDPDVLNSNYVDLKFVADDAAVTVTSGLVGGLLEQRDTFIGGRITELDSLAGEIITDVNALHAAGRGLDGSTGNAFFAGTDASNVAVAAGIVADIATIAAATNWDIANGTPPGDGTNANAITDLQYATQAALANGTYDSFFEGIVGTVASAAREANQLALGQMQLVQQLEQVRQSTAGVNLDEEMIDLTRYQRAFQAAARVIAVVDEMLDQLINRTI